MTPSAAAPRAPILDIHAEPAEFQFGSRSGGFVADRDTSGVPQRMMWRSGLGDPRGVAQRRLPLRPWGQTLGCGRVVPDRGPHKVLGCSTSCCIPAQAQCSVDLALDWRTRVEFAASSVESRPDLPEVVRFRSRLRPIGAQMGTTWVHSRRLCRGFGPEAAEVRPSSTQLWGDLNRM